MNLWFRVLWLFVTAPFRARIEPPFGASRIRFRVWLTDLDTNLHMNNGRYLTIADLGRTDLMVQSGMWKAILKAGLVPMLSGTAIRYRRELKPFQPFTLESRLVGWRATSFVMEHRFVTSGPKGDPVTAAVALVRAGLYSRKDRQFVPAEQLVRLAGYQGESPGFAPDIEDFLALEDGLKRR